MDKKYQKLESLKKKQAQIKARIQTLESAEKYRERKRETRRKILIGSYYLDKAKNENKLDEIVRIMEGYLKRNSDRVLFELKSLELEVSE